MADDSTDLGVAAVDEVPVADVPVEVLEEHPSAPLPDLPLDDSTDWSSDWSWPPYAPLEPAGGRRYDCEDWAPSSTVRRPVVRVGRWTLLYRRGR